MTLEQISTILNTSIVPAIMGDDYTINPDLSNIVDFGTKISEMTADQFKTYFNEFCAAVRTVADTREYSPEELPLYVDSEEYGGLVQSIKSDFTETRNSNLYSLVDGQTYNDVNKYFGTSFDNKIFEKDVTWGMAKSIPNTMWKKAFLNAEGVSQLVALVEVWYRNTIRRNSSAMEHNLISGLITRGKDINLVTMYNDMLTTGKIAQSASTGTIGESAATWTSGEQVAVTSDNCIYNKYFMQWASETIANIIKVARFANKKYNDGTVSTYTTESDSIMIYNTMFANRMKALNISEPTGAKIYNTPFWNAQTDSLIPTIKNSAHVIYTDDGKATGNKSKDYVIGVLYDRWAVGYTLTPIAPRMAYNADGDFYTQFTDFNNRYWVDTRNTAIVFTLN